ncbi:MAG: hypothetical protein R3E64_02810 [Halioglobus sp.]
MITWTKRALLTLAFLGLIATNILTVTHAAFNAAVSGILGTALGVKTVSGLLQHRLAVQDKVIEAQKSKVLKQKAATKRFGKRIATRTRRVAAKSIAAIPAEAIPFIGVAVLVADTSYELYAACENIKDLDQLYADLGIEDETAEDTMHSVCDPKLPDPGDVWKGVVNKADQWWDELVDAV